MLAREAVALASGVPEDDIATRAGVLALLISARHGYGGAAAAEYDHPDSANLIRLVERRRGLPVALGIIWLHAARAAGWAAHGIDFPGHFLLALKGETTMVLDVFAGGTPLDAGALRRLLRAAEGPRAELRAGLLAPMTVRAVLLRLQNNIKLRRLAAGDVVGALSCAEDMLRVAPDTAGLWREAGLLHQHLDQVAAALRCYERFLLLVPQGEAAEHARNTMGQLRSRLN